MILFSIVPQLLQGYNLINTGREKCDQLHFYRAILKNDKEKHSKHIRRGVTVHAKLYGIHAKLHVYMCIYFLLA